MVCTKIIEAFFDPNSALAGIYQNAEVGDSSEAEQYVRSDGERSGNKSAHGDKPDRNHQRSPLPDSLSHRNDKSGGKNENID